MNTNPSLLAVSRTVGVPVTAEAPELSWKREVLLAGGAGGAFHLACATVRPRDLSDDPLVDVKEVPGRIL